MLTSVWSYNMKCLCLLLTVMCINLPESHCCLNIIWFYFRKKKNHLSFSTGFAGYLEGVWHICTKWKSCHKAVSNFIWSRIMCSIVAHNLFIPLKKIYPIIFNFYAPVWMIFFCLAIFVTLQ